MTFAPQSGYSSRQLNAGLVRNRGVEISLGGIPVRTKDFQWDVDFNIAKNDNKLVRLNDEINEYLLEGNRFYYYWYLKAKVGSPIGVITTMSRFKRNEQGELIGINDVGFVRLPDGTEYTIAVFVKDSAESAEDTAGIIARISEIVYHCTMYNRKVD